MKSSVDTTQEVQEKKFVRVDYKSTPNKQVAVLGSPKTEFEAIDTQNENNVVGEGITNKDGVGLALCSVMSPYVTVRLKK